MELTHDTVFYTRLYLFWKQLIQPFEAQKCWYLDQQLHVERWDPSMDALAVWVCLNHAGRMVSHSSNGEVSRDLRSLENDVSFLYFRLFTLTSLPTNQALPLYPPVFPCECQFQLYLQFFIYRKHFLHFLLNWGNFHNKWKVFSFTCDDCWTLNNSTLVFTTRVPTKMIWLGLLASNTCFIDWIYYRNRSSACFIGYFAGPIITLVSQKLHEWKCVKIQGSFCQQDFIIRMFNRRKCKSEDM